MGRSPGFASAPCNYVALFRLGFPSAPLGYNLALQQRTTRRLIMQKARSHTTRVLLQLVSTWFQVLFTPLIGVLFIIQSPYWFTIGRPGVLSLGGWTPHVHTEFHELRATQEHLGWQST